MEKKPRQKSRRWILFVGIAVVVVAAAAFITLPLLRARAATGTTTYRTEAVTTGSISTTVGASGTVYTRQTVTLNWETSGTVSAVHVTKGQQVHKGDVLGELDPASLPLTVINARNDLATAQKALDDLLNSNTARANAQMTLIQAEQDLVSAQKTAKSKTYQRASQETIDIARANLIQAQAALNRATDIYNQNKNRSSDDVQYAAALSQYASAQQKVDQATYNLQYLTSLPDALTVEQSTAAVELAQAKYDDARRAWERVKDGPNPQDVAAAQAKVDSAQAVLDQAALTAPISGTVTAIKSQVGDLVNPQTTAFQISDISHLYTDIAVSEVDINQVQIGQPAEVTFDAIADKTYTGVVTDIDTAGTSTGGGVNFNVTIQVTGADAQVRPGMTASANIVTLEKSNVLLVPSSIIRTVNSREIVYVMKNSVLTPVTVTTGDTSSSNRTEITAGLQAGDLVVLNPPSSTTTTTTRTGLFGGLFGGLLGGRGGGNPPADFGGGNNTGRNNTGTNNSGTNNSGALPGGSAPANGG